MNLDETKSLMKNASETDGTPRLSVLELTSLPQILISELKRQSITYEEMAIQIGVSLSTFKRLVAKPSSAKAINLHALLKELGITVWLEK
ncbi:XRE family transcriptional regulator [Trabulsiella odontotermitis]|uniref:XRE family transcriptional regulator n=1 Tax=Trabulsiella odontotermitis TaxID=379893 RepID=UPI000AAE159F|nr:XRE family transcriptional regulator [Trabulsiella odontotermitis]